MMGSVTGMNGTPGGAGNSGMGTTFGEGTTLGDSMGDVTVASGRDSLQSGGPSPYTPHRSSYPTIRELQHKILNVETQPPPSRRMRRQCPLNDRAAQPLHSRANISDHAFWFE
jgi:hypothetical protein